MLKGEKNEWKTSYRGIKQKINAFEKDILKNFPFSKTTTMKNEILVIAEGEEKRNFNREKERETIYQSIKGIRADIYRFKEKVKMYDNNPEYLMKLEELSDGLLKKINDFKAKQMEIFDEVINEEEKLTKELELFMENIENFEKPVTEKTQQIMKKIEANQKFKANPQNQMMEKYAVLWDDKESDQENDELEEDSEEYDSEGEVIPRDKRKNQKIEEEDDENDEEKLMKRELIEMEGDYLAQEDNLDIKAHFDKENVKVNANIKKEGINSEMEIIKSDIDKINKDIGENGGKNCGWDKDDHEIFLKLRTKHKNNTSKIAFLNECVLALPLHDEEDVKEHVEDFNNYLKLEDYKKYLSNKYKELKDQQKNNLKKQYEEEERAHRESLKKNQTVNKKSVEREKVLVKEKVKEWKIRKLSEKEVTRERELFDKLDKRKEKEQADKEKRERIAQQVKEFKEQKEVERLRKKEKEAYEKSLQKKNLDPIDMLRLKSKEDTILEKRKELLQKKIMKVEEKSIKEYKLMEKKAIKYAYVEPKLNEVTVASKAHKRDKFDPLKDQAKLPDTFGGFLPTQGLRAVPAWRKGL